MKQNYLLINIFLSALLLSLSTYGQPQKKPNIIIFLMDDMGYGDVGALNPKGGIPTPHLDQLVEKGVTFTYGHSSASVCAPSRYALLTGNHVYRGREPMGTWGATAKSQVLHGQTTIAGMLRRQGYATAFFGKLHLGGQFYDAKGNKGANLQGADLSKRFCDGPIDMGFDHSLTLPSGIQSEPYAFFLNDRLARWSSGEDKFQHFASDKLARQFFKKTEIGYAIDNWDSSAVGPLLMSNALQFIDTHMSRYADSKPFFIHYCSQAGHTPYTPPAAFNVKDPLRVDDTEAEGAIKIKGQTLSSRTDMIYEGDVSIGLFLEKLKEKGVLDNTLIIFASDNGVAKGVDYKWTNPIYTDAQDGKYGGDRIEFSHDDAERTHINGQGVALNGQPLRGKKGYIYEGGHRIPFIFRWDKGIVGGRKINHEIIALHDIYRTLAEITGADIKDGEAADSISFASVLTNSKVHQEPVRNELFIQANRPSEQGKHKDNAWAYYQLSRDKELKLYKAIIDNSKTAPQRNAARAKIYQLFELNADPSEAHPLHDKELMMKMERNYKKYLEKN